ncbi:MAG: hypothetical protein A2908_03415 [Candidatus Staskawiczbacteria bacterium RIFCSPLOWO2_01_FULL_38_12b]|uniref:Glycosyl hydrolase family 13 catalytic domain-containing protein n=1 Tax=Candidatus Staskawiczbacteria bacterium RIFCSPLOWO2_01_FULL_38_12b TaxID=1802214 RepID=A0A1G2IHQ6_9BACT|nr:MAG: hypothetical protein A2908_03415 [Candidatus Staskawiczbacteria bacterium RIFCSPLOWO2_01_FULL_38_12b]QBM02644.1 trehalose synthase/amylase TreS [uncultured archaeon]
MLNTAHSEKKYWCKNAIIYEVYVDKFCDTFNGFADKLPYLVSLGVTCIHVLPHYPSPMIDDGYDIADYTSVRKDLGTIEDFKDFLLKAHDAGIKVMVDFVLNHTSTQHPWFLEASNSALSSKRDFYLWSKTATEYAKAPNLFPDLKEKNWIYNPKTDNYYFSTFHHAQADLNWNNPDVFDQMMSVLDFWVALGVDAFRLDAVSHLIKKEGTICDGLPETHNAIKKVRTYLDRKYDNIVLLAEVGDSIKESKKYFGKGDECHLVYNFPLVGRLLLALKKGEAVLPKKFIETLSGIPESCDWVNFLGHHDEMALGMTVKKERQGLFLHFDPENKYRFAIGISLRIATMLHKNNQDIIRAFGMLLGVPGSCIIYYGDEIGMENESLPLDQKDTRKSLGGKFDWSVAGQQVLDNNSLFLQISNIINNRNVNKNS